jgi:hypothetical protein
MHDDLCFSPALLAYLMLSSHSFASYGVTKAFVLIFPVLSSIERGWGHRAKVTAHFCIGPGDLTFFSVFFLLQFEE